MNERVCSSADLVDLDLICLTDGRGRFLPHDKYPRKTWKFWERHRTRNEYIEDEHKKRIENRECHVWKGKEFHLCTQAG